VWGIAALVIVLTLALQGWIALMLRRSWRKMRGSKKMGEFDSQLAFRAAAFTVYELFIVSISILLINNENSIPPKLMQASTPLAVFFILASQPDVYNSWIFCCRAPESDEVDSSNFQSQPQRKEPLNTTMVSKPLEAGPVSMIEALEETTFPEIGQIETKRASEYNTSRAAFRSPRSPAPAPRAVVYAARHAPSASAGSLATAHLSTLAPARHARSGSVTGSQMSSFGTVSVDETSTFNSSWGSERGLLAAAREYGLGGDASPRSARTPHSAQSPRSGLRQAYR